MNREEEVLWEDVDVCMSGEKAKDFKGSMAKLFRYMGRYKFRFILMFIFAVAGTVFSIVGPKILR